jgi:hypothetical protein
MNPDERQRMQREINAHYRKGVRLMRLAVLVMAAAIALALGAALLNWWSR